MPGEKWGQGRDLRGPAFSTFPLPQTTGSHHTHSRAHLTRVHTLTRTPPMYTPPARHTHPGTQTPLRGSLVREALCVGPSRK